MSLPDCSQTSLFAASNELPDLLPEDDPMMVFSNVIYPSFRDRDFEVCYSESGRPAISPAFLACVTLLQFRENLSDSEAAAAVIRRLDWKIALHIPIWQNTSFDPSTLSYFRKRLRENGKMRLIFDKTVELAQSYGFIRKHTNQRVDATHVISHVNRIATTDLLFRAVRCVVEEIEKRAIEVYRNNVPEYLKERYRNDFSSFGMSKEKRQDRQAEIVEDGFLLKSLLEQHCCEGMEAFGQLKIMETIFEENVIIKKNHFRQAHHRSRGDSSS
jgi:transposase